GGPPPSGAHADPPAPFRKVRRVMTSGEPVTVINPFEVPAGRDELFIGGWERGAGFLSAPDGDLDSGHQRSLDPSTDLRFVQVAHWRSREAFEAALRDPAFPGRRMPFASHAALYMVIRR